jgi:hypothetical protein
MGALNSDLHEFDKDGEDLVFRVPYLDEAPKFSLSRLAKLRSGLFQSLDPEAESFGDFLTFPVLERVAEIACQTLRLSSRDAVLRSLYPRLTEKIGKGTLFSLSVFISGNVDILSKGMSIPEWKDVSVPIWVPVEVMDISPYYSDRAVGKCIEVFVSAGIPAGSIISQCISNKFIQYMLREVGYPRYKKFEPDEIFNTRFTCHLLRDQRRTRMVAFSASSSQREHNRNLYRIRHGECPFSFPFECTSCRKGSTDCVAAIHRRPYVIGDCERGHRGIMEEGCLICLSCVDKDLREESRTRYERNKKDGDTSKVYAHPS